MKRLLVISALLMTLSSCEFIFGSKDDSTIDEVLEQGAIDPNLIPNTVGYVPVLPIWDGMSSPNDVFVGYDEMVYVVDDRGLNVYDLKGDLQRTVFIPGANKVTQDRQLRTYVCGRIDQTVNGNPYNLAAVYILSNTATSAQPVFLDTLIHPFTDKSRNNTNFRGAKDEEVEFTGVSTLSDNSFYLARRGPTNNLASFSLPDNSILVYNKELQNTGFARGLNSVQSNLRSILSVSGISSLAAPPQIVFGMNDSKDIVITQEDGKAEYKVLWIRHTINPETGPQYTENINMLDFDTTKAEKFLYSSFRFKKPSDVCIAPDGTAYIFIVDAETDSLYQFTSNGYEGVNPPANKGIKKQIIASFGGEGGGPFQFREPSGIAYFKKTLYVADRGNNRIMRYKLSTDLE